MKAKLPQKILYVITKSNFGGAQKYVYELSVQMKEKGVDVVVAMGGEGLLKEKLEQAHIRTILIKNLTRDIRLSDDLRVFFELIKILKNEKPDVVHLNSSKVGALGALAGRIAGVKKIIFTAHGWAFNEERGVIQKAVIRFISWITACFCHTIIAVSEYDKKQVERVYCIKNKTYTIYNGLTPFPLKEKHRARRELLKEVGGKTDTIWVGTIAELHKNKGLLYTVGAIKMLPERIREKIIFVIVGEGEQRDILETTIRNFGMEKQVFLAGYREGAPSALSAFDIFILPSIKEGLPYSILEAGYAGLPVISTTVGGIPEIITDMESGILVHPKNPGEIAKAIEYLLDNNKKMMKFGKRLHKIVIKKFSTEEMIQKTVQLYVN